ncbi:MAG TPA: type VI secretion system protein TssA [Polyangiaceae bacterium]|nr:type VI secretion system protein TssA [Polyangiaceae bacterium]
MPLIDTENLLQPIAGDEPTGTNLEYDPAFAALERIAQGKPEQQMGETIVPGEPPDWKAVHDQAATLLGRSKDLRIVSHLVRALLHRSGFIGLSEGLSVMCGLLERYWAPLHPRLDPDDQHDPTIRISALALLSDPSLLIALRSAPLIASRTFGAISLRDIAVASGEIAAAAEAPKMETTTIEAAFQDVTDEALEATATAITRAFEHLRRIEAVFTGSAGVAGPDVTGLTQILNQANRAVGPRLERRKAAAAAMAAGAAGETTVHANGTGARMAVSGEITSREDVVRALDKICDYYARHEPSSPLPLLLQRCKRLATMSFIEIVREMVPDGLSQIEIIAGKREG